MPIPPAALSVAGEQLRLLHVHAHPDDESSKGAATSAMYVAQGVRVVVATCTGGERGSVLNPKLDRPEVWANIAEIRRREMERAREILGIEHVSLGFVDSGLPEGDPAPALPEGSFGLVDPIVAAVPLVRVIRELRPHVLTTYDERGGYPHPDHIQCHRVSIAALRLAADDGYRPDLGASWNVPKVYYQVGFHRKRFAALDQAMHEMGLASPYSKQLADWNDRQYEHRITTRVPCSDYFEVRDEALRAHASQVDPDGLWFRVPIDVQQRVWPTEDWQLVYSSARTVMPEDDLFAGLRPEPPRAPDPSDLWAS